MKRIVILCLSCLLFFSACNQGPTHKSSEDILKEMHAVLDSNDFAEIKLIKIRSLKSDLASAYIDEKKYGMAIEALTQLIEENRQPERDFYGHPLKPHSTTYGLEAAYFDMLALVYERQGDMGSKEKALNKKEQAKAEEARLKAIEDKLPQKKKKSILE